MARAADVKLMMLSAGGACVLPIGNLPYLGRKLIRPLRQVAIQPCGSSSAETIGPPINGHIH